MENQIQKAKQESTSVVLRQQGKSYSLNDLGEELKNFSETDRMIIDARKKGFSLCDQTPEQLEISLTGIIFNISVICGCPLPTHEAHINALEKEFGIFLNDNGYSGLTVEEVLTAFRMNASFKLSEKIEIYGAIFNIDYAAKVLRLYVQKRGRVDDQVESIFYEKDVRAELQKDSNRRRKKVAEQYEKYFADSNAELDLSDCFMQLAEDHAFSKNPIQDELTYFKGADPLQRLLNSYQNIDLKFDREKAVVKYLFENMKAMGWPKVYDENFTLLHPGFEVPQRFEIKTDVKDDFA